MELLEDQDEIQGVISTEIEKRRLWRPRISKATGMEDREEVKACSVAELSGCQGNMFISTPNTVTRDPNNTFERRQREEERRGA